MSNNQPYGNTWQERPEDIILLRNRTQKNFILDSHRPLVSTPDAECEHCARFSTFLKSSNFSIKANLPSSDCVGCPTCEVLSPEFSVSCPLLLLFGF